MLSWEFNMNSISPVEYALEYITTEGACIVGNRNTHWNTSSIKNIDVTRGAAVARERPQGSFGTQRNLIDGFNTLEGLSMMEPRYIRLWIDH